MKPRHFSGCESDLGLCKVKYETETLTRLEDLEADKSRLQVKEIFMY